VSALSAGLSFCDVCGESVPTRDFESGAAVRRGGRVLCAQHAAESREADSVARRSSSGAWVAVLAVAGLAAGVAALVVAIRKPSADDLAAAAERDRIVAGDLAGRLASSRDELSRAIADEAAGRSALAARLDALEQRAAAVAGRADGLAARIGDVEASLASTGAGAAEKLAALRAEVEPLRAEIASLRAALESGRASETATPPAESVPDSAEAALRREVEAQRRLLVAPDPAARFSALVEIAKKLGPQSAGDVAVALSDTDPFIRAFAARLLGDFRLRESVPDLLLALRDSDADVRRAGLQSVRAIAGSDFGYDPDAALEARAAAVRRVEEWYRADAKVR